MTNEEFEAFKSKALEQLKSGKSLTGKDGVFAPLLKNFIDAALEAGLDVPLLAPFLPQKLPVTDWKSARA